MAEVNKTLEEGFQSLEALYQKGSGAVESVKFIAITLRKLPTVDIGTPTVRPFCPKKPSFKIFAKKNSCHLAYIVVRSYT